MASKKITQLPQILPNQITNLDVLPIVDVDVNTTKKVTILDLKNNILSAITENITYSNLFNDVVNGQLTPGQWYRLTDYRSVNFLNGWTIANQNPTPIDPNFDPQEIYTGETEVLILQAVSPYEISQIGYSETYQGDIIQYEPFTNKIGVEIDIYNGQTLPDSSTVSGFDLQWDGSNVYFDMPAGYPSLFGHFFYLYCEFSGGSYYQDGVFEPLTPNISICQYSFTSDDPDFAYSKSTSRIRVENNGQKIVLLDLDFNDYTNYDLDTLYVQTIYEIGDAYGWVTKREDTFRNIIAPFDFRGRKYRRFEVDLSGVNTQFSTGYYGQGDNFLGQGTTGNYKDFKSFGQDGYESFDIQWVDMGGPDELYYRGFNDNFIAVGNFYQNNIRIGCYNNTLGENFYQNTIKSPFFSNTLAFFAVTYGNEINLNFNDNTISSIFELNKIESFINNTIQGGFSNNKFGFACINNTIGSGFQSNVIESSFSQNTIGNSFINNNINGAFFQNIVVNNFRFNDIQIDILSTNFTTSTHVYGNYTCNIFQRSNGTSRLSFVDGTDTVIYTGITT